MAVETNQSPSMSVVMSSGGVNHENESQMNLEIDVNQGTLVNQVSSAIAIDERIQDSHDQTANDYQIPWMFNLDAISDETLNQWIASVKPSKFLNEILATDKTFWLTKVQHALSKE